MSDYLLVHGAVHGGWCWSLVADRLRADGHRVFTPTLTGVGERLHLTGPGINLDTHIQDLMSVVDSEELDDVVLVAHSYGGLPATGLLDRRPERIRTAVYLDAMVGVDGANALDGLDQVLIDEKLANASMVNGTRVFKPLEPRAYGLDRRDDLEWVARRLTTQPALTYTQPLSLQHPTGNGRPCRYVRCVDPRLPSFDRHEQAAKARGWPISRLAAGHDAMISHPELVVWAVVSA